MIFNWEGYLIHCTRCNTKSDNKLKWNKASNGIIICRHLKLNTLSIIMCYGFFYFRLIKLILLSTTYISKHIYEAPFPYLNWTLWIGCSITVTTTVAPPLPEASRPAIRRRAHLSNEVVLKLIPLGDGFTWVFKHFKPMLTSLADELGPNSTTSHELIASNPEIKIYILITWEK